MKEIITLQFGPYANHVGAHWWNFQVCCRQLTTILVATGLPYTLLHGVCVYRMSCSVQCSLPAMLSQSSMHPSCIEKGALKRCTKCR